MTEHQSSRTLVKSTPELWAECSDAASLARHLGAFGEIRITKLEPESTVAWEGAAASGTVKLESSGWGTRVTLTVKEEEATAPTPEPEPEPQATASPEPEAASEPEPEAEPDPEPEPTATEPELELVAVEPAPRPGMFARFRLALRRKPVAIEPEPEAPEAPQAPEAPAPDAAIEPEPPEPEPSPAREPAAETPSEPELPRLTGEAALVAALDSLGMAHHRPYSRA